jgi:hypothetical protein
LKLLKYILPAYFGFIAISGDWSVDERQSLVGN